MKKHLPLLVRSRATCLRFSGFTGALITLASLAFGQTFTPAVSYNAGSNANPLGLAVADVNGDGKRDLITANNGSSMVGVLLGMARVHSRR
jgi:hypothetical protein